MRKFYLVTILLAIFYFGGGWVAVWLGWMQESVYFQYAGLVGTLASVLALVALTKPVLSHSDLKKVELDTLKSVADTVESLKALESTHEKTKQEIDGLEIKKKQMELLVKKASLALFLKEQYSYYESQVLEELSKNSRLSETLEKLTESAGKIAALNEEIDLDPNALLLRQIVEDSRRRAVVEVHFSSILSQALTHFFRVLR